MTNVEQEPITIAFEYTSAEMLRGIREMNPSRRKRRRAYLGWALVILLGSTLYAVISKSSSSPPAPAQPAPAPGSFLNDFVLPFLPWLVVFFVVWFFLFGVIRRGRGRWLDELAGKSQTFIFRPEGVTVIGLHSREELQWPVFVRFEETKQFFLLKTSTISGRIIPKRVFKDEAEMGRFRTMLNDHLDSPTAQRAFPVILNNPPQKNQHGPLA